MDILDTSDTPDAPEPLVPLTAHLQRALKALEDHIRLVRMESPQSAELIASATSRLASEVWDMMLLPADQRVALTMPPSLVGLLTRVIAEADTQAVAFERLDAAAGVEEGLEGMMAVFWIVENVIIILMEFLGGLRSGWGFQPSRDTPLATPLGMN